MSKSFPFVSEQIIEQQLAQFQQEEVEYDAFIKELEERQPYLLAYLLSDSFTLLTQQEKDYLLYIVLVIWKSAVAKNEGTIAIVSEEQIGTCEENNWDKLDNAKAKRFRDKLDVFFQNTPQEDLLAFVEDSLADDDDSDEDFLTKVGRELIFIGAKTTIDVLTS